MVNKKVEIPDNDESNDDEDPMAETCASIDNIKHKDLSLEDNVLHIQQS